MLSVGRWIAEALPPSAWSSLGGWLAAAPPSQLFQACRSAGSSEKRRERSERKAKSGGTSGAGS
eukprot:scaffold59540_cov58-Phaeocystis_antarctica.AAC.3